MRGPPAPPALRLQLRPPAVGSRSGLRSSWRPAEEGSGGRGPGDATPRAPLPPNRLLPGRSPTGLAGVVVRADRLRRPPPRPISDRTTWRHETRLRPLVVELSGSSKRPWPVGGRRPRASVWRPPSPHAQAADAFSGRSWSCRLARRRFSGVLLREEGEVAASAMKEPSLAPGSPSAWSGPLGMDW